MENNFNPFKNPYTKEPDELVENMGIDIREEEGETVKDPFVNPYAKKPDELLEDSGLETPESIMNYELSKITDFNDSIKTVVRETLIGIIKTDQKLAQPEAFKQIFNSVIEHLRGLEPKVLNNYASLAEEVEDQVVEEMPRLKLAA